MKYYHRTKVINEGLPNEYIYDEGYLIRDLPIGKPVYGFAYDINDDTENKRLICLPVLGEIVKNEGIKCGLWGSYVFIPYKKGTRERRKSGIVTYDARLYADTYEEAVDMYNELVQKRVDNLYRMAELAKADIIQVST